MGSIPLDNGESVYIHDGTGSADPVAISAAEGSSIANLMKNRERFDYTWANATERSAQTGMVQGSRGYQEDARSEHIYDNSVWRLALPYIEFYAGSQSIAAATTVAQTGWTIESSTSTDAGLVTVSSNVFTFTRAGIYSFSSTSSIGTAGATSYQTLTSDPAATGHQSLSSFAGVTVGTLSLPSYRIVSDGTPLYLWVYNSSATTIDNRRVRIARLG